MTLVIMGKVYGTLVPSRIQESKPRREPRVRCACVVCKAVVALTPKKVVRGRCPECN